MINTWSEILQCILFLSFIHSESWGEYGVLVLLIQNMSHTLSVCHCTYVLLSTHIGLVYPNIYMIPCLWEIYENLGGKVSQILFLVSVAQFKSYGDCTFARDYEYSFSWKYQICSCITHTFKMFTPQHF